MKRAQSPSGKTLIDVVLVLVAALVPAVPDSWAQSQVTPGSLAVRWDEGSPDCSKGTHNPLQVYSYNNQTFILRQNLCSTFEAPFMYLLVGSRRALLIDTGDVADPKKMPLAETVMRLLPAAGQGKIPLLVVHTHRHLDHRAGDPQFTGLANVEVVGFDLASVRRFYHFTEWPNGRAEIDLGGRVIDVVPTPGHNETEVSFYDRNTALFFTGDFLLPARLLVDDTQAYIASAERAAAFVRDLPLTFILGGHIEMNSQGKMFDWGSQYHLDEHVLQLTRADLMALPAVLRSFNGFYTERGNFVMMNWIRILIVLAIAAGLVLSGILAMIIRSLGRRRAHRKALEAEVQNSRTR
jgi:hydroxyacylglutathione hydrolase